MKTAKGNFTPGPGLSATITMRCLLIACLVLVATLLPRSSLAHPHILIDAQIDVLFDDYGQINGLHHAWTFDPAFSAWIAQGLDTNGDGTLSPEELQPLADENVADLASYGFYTYAGRLEAPLRFHSASDQGFTYENGRMALRFTLSANQPTPVGRRFELAVYDPEYYVAITFAGSKAVRLVNAPESCSAVLVPPQPMSPELEQQLYALPPDIFELPPDLAAAMRGTQGEIIIVCGDLPPAPPSSALEAVNEVARARSSIPFGGPPPEPGFALPRTGFFGWLQDQQRDFYTVMTRLLDALRSDWTAFWLLGGLSFLYGIFHAAGPGHGKMVISSYVLANVTQLRRGIVLSVLSALLQSLVAILFVLIAAGLPGMTALAMGEAANWIGITSYGMVALLGTWLLLRKIFGWGHHHTSPPNDMVHKAHAHLHGHDDCQHHDGHDHDRHAHGDHDHTHIVLPEATSGSLREQIGVVLAVGLRPCSGALVVLVFALSQGLLLAGILAVLLMGIGTAITVALLATLAVTAKGMAMRIGGRIDNPVAAKIAWWLELLGALAVLGFGLLLLLTSF